MNRRFDRFYASLMGNRPEPLPPPRQDSPAEIAVLAKQVEERLPTLERGKAWLMDVRDDGPLLDCYGPTVLAAVPALRMSATASWLDLMKAPSWVPPLDSDQLVRLLAAMLAWQVAVGQRVFEHLDIHAETLCQFVWPPLVGETETYLIGQTATDAVLDGFRQRAGEVQSLVTLAVDAPDAEEDTGQLIEATQSWCRLSEHTSAAEALASQWRIMDVAAIGLWYRAFGEHLQEAG